MADFPKLTYKVDTIIDSDGLITQDVYCMEQKIAQFVMNTRDAQVKQALIALGWTPPPEGFNPTHNGY